MTQLYSIKTMTPQEWKEEFLASYSTEKYAFKDMLFHRNYNYQEKDIIFKIETELTQDEKLAFIDLITDGAGSQLLQLMEKWESEKVDLPQDRHGNVKTVSKKAWHKRSVPSSKWFSINNESIYKYWFIGHSYAGFDNECQSGLSYGGKHIVHQWFHDLAYNLKREEIKHYRDNSPFYQKLERIQKYGEHFGLFDSQVINDIVWNRKEDVTEEQLDYYIEQYEKLESLYNIIKNNLKEF